MKNCCKSVEANAVYWNPYNKVVQCHACGHIYVKAYGWQYKLNRLLNYRWWGR